VTCNIYNIADHGVIYIAEINSFGNQLNIYTTTKYNVNACDVTEYKKTGEWKVSDSISVYSYKLLYSSFINL